MSAADPATLAAIQRVTRRCLAAIDRVCSLPGVRYVAYGGTAIGAVRHQGFSRGTTTGTCAYPGRITNVSSPRLPALLGEEFFIASPATHPDYPISFGVLA